MTGEHYADAIDDAYGRLEGIGFEFGPGFASHAPMAAEALITLGFGQEVPAWIEQNVRRRRYHDQIPAWQRIGEEDPAQWRLALGDYCRAGDWARFFEERVAAQPWHEVLTEWWPRLLDGAFAALTHGLIRTAHAVRALLTTAPPPSARASPPQLRELAAGLAYWAARYTPVPPVPSSPVKAVTGADDVSTALSDLTVARAGWYARRAPRPPVPFVHTITAPAAIRLVLPLLTPELQVRSYVVATRLATAVEQVFPWSDGGGPAAAVDYRPPSISEITARAVDVGDEHAIKLAEACRREYAVRPDERYLAAADTYNAHYLRSGAK
jgi:hypothetical protein